LKRWVSGGLFTEVNSHQTDNLADDRVPPI